MMEAQPDLQRLLQRHGEIQRAMRRPGGIRITEERELFAIREQLKNFPAALQSLPPNATREAPPEPPRPRIRGRRALASLLGRTRTTRQ
jgi:hypothetical protein